MIFRSKAPLRLGLAGGGTDVSPYSDTFGGYVLNATINLYAYCTIVETTDGMISIDAYDAQCSESYPFSTYLEIDGKANLIKGVFNRILKDYPEHQDVIRRGFRISTYNDAPIGSGLGTSSTMVVCILKCFCEWLNLPLGDYELARLSYEIERLDLQLAGGKQDQYAAAFGGFNFMEFLTNDMVIVNPLRIKRWVIDELEASMVLYYTGRSRSSAAIISEQQKNASSGNAKTIDALHKIRQSSLDMKVALLKGDLSRLATILGQGWEEKKRTAGAISNPIIQEAMDAAMSAGAISGKVSGAGGGGFMMLMVEPTKKMDVVSALEKLGGKIVLFQFSDEGAKSWRLPSKQIDY